MSNDALALSAFCLACLLHGVAEVADCAVARENGDAEEVRCTILTEVAFAWWCHPGVNPDSIVSLHAVCTLLRMGSPARAVASEIVMNIEREGLRGRHSPHSLAAVAVIRTCELLCLHPTMTQQQFCNLLDVTDNTIRGILRTLSSKWERLDPERLRLPKPIWLREYPRPSRVLSRGGHVIAPAVPEIVRPAFTFEDAIAFHHRTRQHLPPSS
ncbi:Transcription factor TFIIB cyclin-like domain-containing protein [Plasmodiophora brassicae]